MISLRGTLLGLAALMLVGSASAYSLTGTIRDFKGRGESGGHVDFEAFIGGVKTGLVSSTLVGKNPTYIGPGGDTAAAGSINSAASFDQWWNPTAFSQSMAYSIEMTDIGGGLYQYSNNSFFPVDGLLWGNTPGQSHNFHFTYEINSQFTYNSSQTNSFTFTGDDDIWVYINNQLVVDLGGIHGTASSTIDVNALAAGLGLTNGQNYDLDVYFAERHTSQSNFTMTTSLQLTPVPEPFTMALGAMGVAAFLRKRIAKKS